MQAPKPENAQLIHTCQFQLRWGDLDQLGHLNNTVYFRAFEQARTEWIAKYPPELDPGNNAYVVIIHTEATFLRELKDLGYATIRIYSGEVGRSSMSQYYELAHSNAPDVVLCTGTAKLVWVDPDTAKSTAIPPRYLRSTTT